MIAVTHADAMDCFHRTRTDLAVTCGRSQGGEPWFCSRTCEEHGSHILIADISGEAPRVMYPADLRGADVEITEDDLGRHYSVRRRLGGLGGIPAAEGSAPMRER